MLPYPEQICHTFCLYSASLFSWQSLPLSYGFWNTIVSSRKNEGEAHIARKIVRSLINAGLPPEEIAVISPYNGQVGLLKALLKPDFPALEISSVDGFQGREKEAVVLSLVRSNASRNVGFLKDDRRLNVAITRAKCFCAVICDSDTVSSHPFLERMIDYFTQHGDVRSAFEFGDDHAPSNVEASSSLHGDGHSSSRNALFSTSLVRALPSSLSLSLSLSLASFL
jgi:ATP-dependent RNA/DNA helicase IGHMBP2